MTVESTTAARWDELHRDRRHRLEHPSEHVVRFLKSLEHLDPGYALDIGCGNGRHLALLEACGYRTYGVDVSAGAVRRAEACMSGNRERRVWRGEMTNLDEHLNVGSGLFDIVLSYGVFYYGTRDDMRKAVSEMHRVMRPGGHGFLCLRSVLDWRAKHRGLAGTLHMPGEPEHGMEMTFLDGQSLYEIVLSSFKSFEVNMTSTTTHDGERANCDWLVSVVK